MQFFFNNLNSVCKEFYTCIPSSQKCSLSDLSQNLLAKFRSINEHGSGEWWLLSLYEHEQILRKPFL